MPYWWKWVRVAKYDHRRFLPSPADSPEVKKAIRQTTAQGSATGIWITVYLALTFILVGWDSPLVVPLSAGFIVIGYLALFGATLSSRAGIHKIVQKAREKRLKGLQERIDDFRPNYTNLSPQESQQLRDLLFLHHDIRDAPATPTTSRTMLHTAVGLIIPSLLFLATVFGEVYAERFLDAILPQTDRAKPASAPSRHRKPTIGSEALVGNSREAMRAATQLPTPAAWSGRAGLLEWSSGR